mgnify:CR=1 FL=1
MTTLEDIGLDSDAIYADIRDGYISMRTHPRESDLRIYNYTAKTQYERAWTKERLACRGLIVWYDGTPPLIGARPLGRGAGGLGKRQAPVPRWRSRGT